MLRRLFVGVALIAAFASMSLLGRQPVAVQASPANQQGSVYFTDHSDDGPENAQVGFGKNEGVVWAIIDTGGRGPGAHLSYILRLNGDDYKWGDIKTGSSTPGQFSLALSNKDSKSKGLPGGAYQLLVYDGDVEIARGGFGVNGGKGSDNDNDH